MTPKERAVVSIQNESETISSLSMMRTAMQQALKAMKDASPYGLTFKEAIIACEEALERPENQEHNSMFMEGYRIGLAEMREACAKVCEEIPEAYTQVPDNNLWCAAAIRAIKFEGDTGFRPVSEMVAEHKQDPKKGAAIEKAKMRKATRAEKIAMSGVYEVPVEQAEQEPVAWYSDKGGFNECGEGQPLYTAPVRTKDLTHEEKAEIVTAYYPFVYKIIDAVIAADRELNK